MRCCRGRALLHAPGEGRGSHRRSFFRPWREDLQPGYLDELEKIVKATSKYGVAATHLNLLVRIRVSSDHAKLSLASKFGADPRDVSSLLFAARQAADALGICFHVGSQAMTPAAFAEAMA